MQLALGATRSHAPTLLGVRLVQPGGRSMDASASDVAAVLLGALEGKDATAARRARGRVRASALTASALQKLLPATTLATYRAVVSAVSSSERACERVRACGSMSVRQYERAC